MARRSGVILRPTEGRAKDPAEPDRSSATQQWHENRPNVILSPAAGGAKDPAESDGSSATREWHQKRPNVIPTLSAAKGRDPVEPDQPGCRREVSDGPDAARYGGPLVLSPSTPETGLEQVPKDLCLVVGNHEADVLEVAGRAPLQGRPQKHHEPLPRERTVHAAQRRHRERTYLP